MVLGQVEKLSTLEVVKYFHSRPRDSQIGARVSQQSSRISARGVLEGKFLELKQKFSQGDVPLPSFWGGFRVKFDAMEFWQGGENRLHDRFSISVKATAGKSIGWRPEFSKYRLQRWRWRRRRFILYAFISPHVSGKLCTSIGAVVTTWSL